MTQLQEKRFELDNKDIRDKTVVGQNKLLNTKAKHDAHERYRAPETTSIYDVPIEGN